MRNVLVALKDRGEAVRLATLAAALAGPLARADVVHVVEGRSGSAAEAEPAVARAVDLLRGRGIAARGHVDVAEEEGVAGRLIERARASGAEVVVMGSRGLGHVGGLVAGSVSHALLAGLDLPLLIVRHGARVPAHRMGRVLVALGSEEDVAAAVAAVQLLPGPPSHVLAIHVPRRVAIHAGRTVPGPFVELGETSTPVLETASGRFAEAGLRIAARTVDRDGGVSESICATAGEWDADLIVLGPRRPGSWQAFAAGSTAHGVLHNCHRPVLIAGRPAR